MPNNVKTHVFSPPQRETHVSDAADQVRDTAAAAKAMLDELQAGWLWKIITIKAKEGN